MLNMMTGKCKHLGNLICMSVCEPVFARQKMEHMKKVIAETCFHHTPADLKVGDCW